MNDTAIQTQTTQGAQSMRAKFAGKTLGGQISGDVFAMLFQQLMGDGEDGENALNALMQQLGGSSQDEQEQDDTLGMQMAAEFLLMNPNSLQSLLQQTTQAGQMLEAVRQALTGGQPKNLAQTAQTQTSADPLAAEEEQEGQVSKTFYQLLENAWKQPAKTENGMEGQMRFISAVREARLALGGKPKEQQQPLDLESLGGAVDARRYVPAAAAEKQAQTLPEAQEIYDQLKSGILENTAKGKNEFVVKLKPAGLGEITVRLSEKDNQISLSIVTSSAQVAKMIADDVTALQNALRPLNAQVQQIVSTTPAGHVENYAAGQQMNAQQGFSEHQQSGKDPGGGRHTRSGAKSEEFGGVVEEVGLQTDTGLDAYI